MLQRTELCGNHRSHHTCARPGKHYRGSWDYPARHQSLLGMEKICQVKKKQGGTKSFHPLLQIHMPDVFLLTQMDFLFFSSSPSLHLDSLWETSQTLFWAIFGLIDLDNFELTGIKEFTRFSGLLMFGSFSVINIIVLLNLLIAMMNHSYQLISVSSVRDERLSDFLDHLLTSASTPQEKADVEWKFARSKLWISYFEEGGKEPNSKRIDYVFSLGP